MGKKSPIYKVSQLIAKLRGLQEIYGDLDIYRMDKEEERKEIKKIKLINLHEDNSFHGPMYIIGID